MSDPEGKSAIPNICQIGTTNPILVRLKVKNAVETGNNLLLNAVLIKERNCRLNTINQNFLPSNLFHFTGDFNKFDNRKTKALASQKI